jgi:hypothetical protein
MTEFVVKENAGFRLRVSKKACLMPKGLYNIEFIQETLKDGEVSNSSTYQFFMTDEDLDVLSKGLTK